MRRRLLTLLLSASLCVSGFSVPAFSFAEEEPAEIQVAAQEAEEYAEIGSVETFDEAQIDPEEFTGEEFPTEELPFEEITEEELIVEAEEEEYAGEEFAEDDLFADDAAEDPIEELEDEEGEDAEEAEARPEGWYWNGTAFVYYDSEGDPVPYEDVYAGISGYVGYVEIDGEKYHLNDEGVPQTGHMILDDGCYYYFGKAGETIPGAMVISSWIKDEDAIGVSWRYYQANGKWKQFGDPGQNVVVRLDKNVDPSVTTAPYVLNDKGYLAYRNRLVKARFSDGKEYYGYTDADGKLLSNCIVTYNGKKYGLVNYKCLIAKVGAFGGKNYYFQSTGAMAEWTNSWHMIPLSNGVSYYQYFGSDSSIVKKTGWQKITVSGKVKWLYFASSGRHFKDTILKTSNGFIFGFSKSGFALGGVASFSGKAYYFKTPTATAHNGYALKGAVRTPTKRIMAYANPTTAVLVKGWKKLGNDLYYFGSNYLAVTNQPMKFGSTWGYLDAYGKWIRAGWKTVKQSNGTEKKYYVNPANGEMYKSCWKTIGGLKYYFQKDGSICTKVDTLPGINYSVYNVSINRAKNIMTIYSPDWKTPIRVFPVSVGKPETPTPVGTFRITATGQRWTELMGPSYGQWASHFSGGCFLHSIPYDRPNSYTMYPGWVLNALGTAQSHGCVRMTTSDVYWVYKHCNGGTIRIYDNEPTPLGTPRKYRIPGGQRFDPTDWTVPQNHLTGPVW